MLVFVLVMSRVDLVEELIVSLLLRNAEFFEAGQHYNWKPVQSLSPSLSLSISYVKNSFHSPCLIYQEKWNRFLIEVYLSCANILN